MRAVQRNNMQCVRYLLNNTASDLNGSAQSTYTPLWFAVSNGYNDLALLLLNYNASSSMVEKSISSAIPLPTSVANTLLLQPEDMSGGLSATTTTTTMTTTSSSIHHHSTTATTTASYLFSPLRASIVYSRFQIMAYLLEFNANVYELFNVTQPSSSHLNLNSSSSSSTNKRRCKLPRPGRAFDAKLNEDYLNTLKFFHRQFAIDEQQLNAAASSSSSSSSTSSSNGSSPLTAAELENQLNILNEFIDDVNVYRRMLIEFVKNLVYRYVFFFSSIFLIDL